MRLTKDFYERDVLIVAPELIGKTIKVNDKTAMIVEVEAYRGEEDLASHARFGKTKRNAVMYCEAGRIYVYLIYGMYWMLNIVTGKVNEPQAALIRGLRIVNSELKQPNLNGPGIVGKWIGLDRSYYGEDLVTSKRIWVEDSSLTIHNSPFTQTTRVGIDYAGVWTKKPWRWILS